MTANLCDDDHGSQAYNAKKKNSGNDQSFQWNGDWFDPNGRKYTGPKEGHLQVLAVSILMTALWTARSARYDLLKAINFLAGRITRWDALCDKRLHRLMCYMRSTKDDVLIGWIGDTPDQLTLHLFVDADFAGCPYTLKSTTGAHMDLQGPNTRFPWAASSTKQSSRAQSTPDAELKALHYGIEHKAIPALDLWQILLRPFIAKDILIPINIQEDNTLAMTCARTGKNAQMKYLERYDGIKIGVIYERVHTGEHNIIHTRSENMTADIYTKPFPNGQSTLWKRLRMLINLYTRDQANAMEFNPHNNEEVVINEHGTYNGAQKIEYDPDCINQQYFHILEGSSTSGSDFRVAAKMKPPVKKKPKYKGAT